MKALQDKIKIVLRSTTRTLEFNEVIKFLMFAKIYSYNLRHTDATSKKWEESKEYLLGNAASHSIQKLELNLLGIS
jgi:hypothetical protein